MNRENYDNLKTAFKNNNDIDDEKDPRLQKFKDYTKGPLSSLIGGRRKSKKTKKKSLKRGRKTRRKSLKKRKRTKRKY